MRVLIASDVHANLPALRKLISSEWFDFGIYLGDIVDYGTRPVEAIDIVKENFDVIMRGNHDFAAATGIDCQCSAENHDLSVYSRESLTNRLLDEGDREFLRKLPVEKDIEIDGVQMHASHGAPDDPVYGYLYPWDATGERLSRLSGGNGSQVFLMGHTHYPMYTQFKGKLYVNPGSAGQPRDHSSLPSYVIWDTGNNEITFKRYSYEPESLKREIISEYSDKKMAERLLRLFRIAD